ncbi:MAG TPA: hypothetical protein VGE47_13885 [Burkholderiaceae bacterium]
MSGLAVSAALLALHQHLPLHPAVWALPLLAAALTWLAAAPSIARLRWDTQMWQAQARHGADESPVRLHPTFDFGNWVLLRAQAEGWRAALAPCYLVLSRRHHPAEWTLLRATLYSQRIAPPGAPESSRRL